MIFDVFAAKISKFPNSQRLYWQFIPKSHNFICQYFPFSQNLFRQREPESRGWDGFCFG
jgi:hypothetical protein